MEKVANATNKDEKLKYQEIINSIDSKIEATKQEAVLKETEAQQFNSVEGYKAALETLKVRNNYMLSGVTEKTSSEIIENIHYVNKHITRIPNDICSKNSYNKLTP